MEVVVSTEAEAFTEAVAAANSNRFDYAQATGGWRNKSCARTV
jgi:hypothetical protein